MFFLIKIYDLFYSSVVSESPRWLLSRGRVEESKTEIARIMKMNKSKANIDDVIAQYYDEESDIDVRWDFRHNSIHGVILLICYL